MTDPAMAARAELRQWLDLAAEARKAGDWELAVHYENDAAEVEARIDALDPEEVSA
jgi:hypothetical protein